MNSQATNAGGSTDFMVFPDLPKELRLMIWKRAIPSSRMMELQYRHGEPDQTGYPMQGHFTPSCPIPVIFSVCQESRSVAQVQYELSFPTAGSRPKVYFNPSLDTLVLSWLGGLAITPIPLIRYYIFDKVEHICFTSWKLEYTLHHLESDFIDAYPGIKTIIAALDVDSPELGLGHLSIEEIELAFEEQTLCTGKTADFQKKWVERHPDRSVPTVTVMSITRHAKR